MLEDFTMKMKEKIIIIKKKKKKPSYIPFKREYISLGVNPCMLWLYNNAKNIHSLKLTTLMTTQNNNKVWITLWVFWFQKSTKFTKNYLLKLHI